MKTVYKADVMITLESDTENRLDLEWCYSTIRKTLRNTLNAPKRTKLTHFGVVQEFDVEGKDLPCADCPDSKTKSQTES